MKQVHFEYDPGVNTLNDNFILGMPMNCLGNGLRVGLEAVMMGRALVPDDPDGAYFPVFRIFFAEPFANEDYEFETTVDGLVVAIEHELADGRAWYKHRSFCDVVGPVSGVAPDQIMEKFKGKFIGD